MGKLRRTLALLFAIFVSLTAGLGRGLLLAQDASVPAVKITRLGLSQNVWPGDFNRDGLTDLAATADPSTGLGNVQVVLGDGTGAFGKPIFTDYVGHVLAVSDIDRDGWIDLVVQNEPRTDISILPGHGDGTFGAAIAVDTRNDLTFASVSDLDGDGHRDLIVGAEPSSVRIYPGQGDFTFGVPVELTSEDFPHDVIVVDLNGDGRRDFVVANRYLANLTVFLNRGGLTFASTILTLGGTGNDVTAGMSTATAPST